MTPHLAALVGSLLVVGTALLWPTGDPGLAVADQRRAGSGQGWAARAVGADPLARGWRGRPVGPHRLLGPVGALASRMRRLALRSWTRRRGDDTVAGDTLLVLDLLAAALSAGAEPQRAVALTAAQLPASSVVRAALTANAADPSRLPQMWRALARQGRVPELEVLAQAWRLSWQAGVPLGAAVERSAAQLREGVAFRGRVQVALAGPRATMWVLTGLPLLGPPVGWALGVDPVRLYWSSPISRAACCVGLVLLAAGWLWCRSLVARVDRPRADRERIDEPAVNTIVSHAEPIWRRS